MMDQLAGPRLGLRHSPGVALPAELQQALTKNDKDFTRFYAEVLIPNLSPISPKVLDLQQLAYIALVKQYATRVDVGQALIYSVLALNPWLISQDYSVQISVYIKLCRLYVKEFPAVQSLLVAYWKEKRYRDNLRRNPIKFWGRKHKGNKQPNSLVGMLYDWDRNQFSG